MSFSLVVFMVRSLNFQVTPVVKGRHFGFDTLPIDGKTSTIMSNLKQEEVMSWKRESGDVGEKGSEERQEDQVFDWSFKTYCPAVPTFGCSESPKDDDEDETQPWIRRFLLLYF